MSIIAYSIAKEWLQGTIGPEKFSFRAWSGGGRGRLAGGAEHTAASYDVFRKEHEAGKTHVHGGPIPPGHYICQHIAHHKTFGECIFLQPTLTALFEIDAKANIRFYGRSGFFIHGRGKHGSDGCIVPENPADRTRLNRAIKNAPSPVLLRVVEKGMPLPARRETAHRFA